MLYEYLSANPRLIFLIDGLGAILSTVLLLFIAYFEDVIGMPKGVLYKLLPVTILFAIYSLSSYLINPQEWKRYLAPIAFANMLYCCLTLVLVFYHFNNLTPLGIAYFFVEILVIALLSSMELRFIYYRLEH